MSIYFCYVIIIIPFEKKWSGPLFEQTWIAITQGFFVSSLVEIWKFTSTQTDRLLRWAKKVLCHSRCGRTKIHKTKHHHSMKTERRHSVTFQSPFSRLNGRYISVTIQCHSVTIPSPFSNIQFPFFPYITDLI